MLDLHKIETCEMMQKLSFSPQLLNTDMYTGTVQSLKVPFVLSVVEYYTVNNSNLCSNMHWNVPFKYKFNLHYIHVSEKMSNVTMYTTMFEDMILFTF